MTETLQVKVVTPNGSLLDEESQAFTASSVLGEFCILPNHRAIMAAIVPSRMVVEQSSGGKAAYALDRGFMEAGADHVNVITERCVPAEKLDGAALKKEVAELEDKLTAMDAYSEEAEEVIQDLEWAKVQLTVAG